MVFTHRFGGRMDRQPDFSKGSGSGLLVNLIVGLIGSILGGWLVSLFRMGSDGHIGELSSLVDHRRHRPAVDRIAVHTAPTR